MSTCCPRAGPLPREQRQRDPLRGEHAGDDVGDGDAEAVGRPVAGAGDAHQPAFGLHHGVVAGLGAARAGLAEPGDRAVHQPRPARRHRLVAESEPLHGAGPEVLDEHVGPVEQPLEHRAPARRLEVQRQAFLVAVDAEEIRALAVDERRSPAARVVPLAGLLDLDDARPHVGQLHGAVGPRQHAREIDDREAGQGRVQSVHGARYHCLQRLVLTGL